MLARSFLLRVHLRYAIAGHYFLRSLDSGRGTRGSDSTEFRAKSAVNFSAQSFARLAVDKPNFAELPLIA
jgi:hypothetical protein